MPAGDMYLQNHSLPPFLWVLLCVPKCMSLRHAVICFVLGYSRLLAGDERRHSPHLQHFMTKYGSKRLGGWKERRKLAVHYVSKVDSIVYHLLSQIIAFYFLLFQFVFPSGLGTYTYLRTNRFSPAPDWLEAVHTRFVKQIFGHNLDWAVFTSPKQNSVCTKKGTGDFQYV